MGAYLSHLYAIKIAKDKNLSKILILEDDANFLDNSNKSFIVPKNADIMYSEDLFLIKSKKLLNY